MLTLSEGRQHISIEATDKKINGKLRGLVDGIWSIQIH